ncbi:hypothetical protein J4Q44_G00184220 [Coregonus suidteri]|uniref:Uncharacterized protein n=1 Tax=Coregonus suidteri TaxID=861788 RepID=A0AAN8LE23_9TELE
MSATKKPKDRPAVIDTPEIEADMTPLFKGNPDEIGPDHHFRKPANDITAQLEINFGDLCRPGRGRGGSPWRKGRPRWRRRPIRPSGSGRGSSTRKAGWIVLFPTLTTQRPSRPWPKTSAPPLARPVSASGH